MYFPKAEREACVYTKRLPAVAGAGPPLQRRSFPKSAESCPRCCPRGLPGLSFFGKSLENLAPRAGFEPATQRLTAACSTC